MSEPRGKVCTCSTKKPRETCPDMLALGLTPGQFQALGAWPAEGAVTTYGALGSLRLQPQRFHVARVLRAPLLRAGLITQPDVVHLDITDAGREMQVKVRATSHWERNYSAS